MTFSTKHTTRTTVIVVICSLFVSAVAFASGDGGGKGQSGGNGHQPVLLVSKGTYELGKKVFLEHVICDSCIYADLELTPESVSASWKAIKKDLRRSGDIGSNLARKERKSVRLFMRKRFNL